MMASRRSCLLAASPQVGQPGPIHPSIHLPTTQSRGRGGFCLAHDISTEAHTPPPPIIISFLFVGPTRPRVGGRRPIRSTENRVHGAAAPSLLPPPLLSSPLLSSSRPRSSRLSPAAFQFQARRPRHRRSPPPPTPRGRPAFAGDLRYESRGWLRDGGAVCLRSPIAASAPARSGEPLPEDDVPGTGERSVFFLKKNWK
jgi:hypothetical protein